MIVVAVIVTDAKRYALLDCLKAIVQNPEPLTIYLNIQTQQPDLYADAIGYLRACGKGFEVDVWQCASSWLPNRKFDQDNDARLTPIIIARNMAVDYAIVKQATHLLFVDSDVIIRKDGLRRLLNSRKAIIGGKVPGRGAHASVDYVFGIHAQEGNLVLCDHGTMGYCLIERNVFRFVRFRQGPHPARTEIWLSEDPCFAADAKLVWKVADGWWIDYSVVAEHRDDPDNPLTWEGALNHYESVSS